MISRILLSAAFLLSTILHSMSDSIGKSGFDVCYEIYHKIIPYTKIAQTYSIAELNEAKICTESYIKLDEQFLENSLEKEFYVDSIKEGKEILSLINSSINQKNNTQ